MEPLEFGKAYYIKLGTGGKREESSINHNIARIGWNNLTLNEINKKDWKQIKSKLLARGTYKSKGTATADANALKVFVESSPDDIWITFHASQLWWGQLQKGKVKQDRVSRYRVMLDKWHNQSIDGNSLFISEIPGSISKIQRFQGTICNVLEVDDLKRLINSEPSLAYREISSAKQTLIKQVQLGVRQLHWKDFETLVDLIFRNAGWRRISVVGETMKFSDLELEEPITRETYQVQIKAKANLNDFERYARQFSRNNFRKLYFVVYTPDRNLSEFRNEYENIELILPELLSEKVVEFGLVDWLLKKIR